MGASYLSHRSYKSYPWQALPRDSRLQPLPRTQIEDGLPDVASRSFRRRAKSGARGRLRTASR